MGFRDKLIKATKVTGKFAFNVGKEVAKTYLKTGERYGEHEELTLDELIRERNRFQRKEREGDQNAATELRVILSSINRRRAAIEQAEKRIYESNRADAETMRKVIEAKERFKPSVEAAKNVLQRQSKKGNSDAADAIRSLKSSGKW